MTEGIIAGVVFYFACWGIYRLIKKWKKHRNTRKLESGPTNSTRYGSEELDNAMDKLNGILVELVDLADTPQSRKKNSSSDDDTWGGIDYD